MAIEKSISICQQNSLDTSKGILTDLYTFQDHPTAIDVYLIYKPDGTPLGMINCLSNARKIVKLLNKYFDKEVI